MIINNVIYIYLKIIIIIVLIARFQKTITVETILYYTIIIIMLTLDIRTRAKVETGWITSGWVLLL